LFLLVIHDRETRDSCGSFQAALGCGNEASGNHTCTLTMATGLAASVAGLSLDTKLALAQPAPIRRQPIAPTKNHARTKLKFFKQAAKSTFRRGRDKNMTSRRTGADIIEISDDDEDDVPNFQPPSANTIPSSQSQISLIDCDDEAELEPSSESSLSRSASPHHKGRRVVLDHRPGHDKEYQQRSASSRVTSDDSGYILKPPRTQQTSQLPHTGASSVPTDGDSGYVTAPPNIPQLNEASSSTPAMTTSLPTHQKSVHNADQCPYYYDDKLDVKMYRGEGYEKFPVVLGTVEGHKEICDKWDAQEASKKKAGDSLPTETGTPPTPTRSIEELEAEDACLQAVLQIFPDIEYEFVRGLYQQGYSGTVGQDAIAVVSSALIADIAESETYPLQKHLKRKAPPMTRDETGVTIAWNKDLPKNHHYCREAIILLASVFDHIPTHYIAKVTREKTSLFDAFGILSENESNFYNQEQSKRPYKRLRQPRRDLEFKYQRRNFVQRDGHLHVSLVNELQAARQSQAREASRIKRQKASDDLESENLAIHMTQGSMVECQCCFDEKPINRAVPCEGEEAHFFCNDCVKRQAESQVGAMKYEMMCMDTSGCKAELSTEGVAQAIPLQLYDKLAFNQQQAEISSASIQGLEMCPFCDFKAICEPVDVDSVFDCQNPDCGLVTCRKCKERSHLPRTCEEIKNDKGLGARHKVEEARSEAMMRACPKCKVKLIKEFGCNKMVCTNCQAIMCYVCKKNISSKGYDHFHRAGATCVLHDQAGVDRHKEEADAAETAAIEKVRTEYDDIDEKLLRVETKENDKSSKLAKTTTISPPPQLGGIPPPAYHGAPPLPLPPPGMPQFPVVPRFDPNLFHLNAQHLLPQGQGQGQELGQLQQDLNQMPALVGQPIDRQGGPALQVDPGLQQRQALQAFLRHRRRNPA
jgi:hypothetical protein